MPARPFDFLLSIPEDQGREWLLHYLREEPTIPAVTVPFDYGQLEFLLNEVSPIRNIALPLRMGDLAGGLLRQTIATRSFNAPPPHLVKALLTLLESLPVSAPVASFLRDLTASGALQEWSLGDGTDLHLAALRALVLHQRSATTTINNLIDFWKGQATDLRYTSIAVQALLRIAPDEAFALIPGFVERASSARPRMPVANLLFAVAVELGGNRALWVLLAARLLRRPAVFELVKEGFNEMRLPRGTVDAWRLLHEIEALTMPLIVDRGEAVVSLMRNHDVRYEASSESLFEHAA